MGIRRWLRNWLNDGSEYEPIRERNHINGLSKSIMTTPPRLETQERVIRLGIYHASGGRIVETSRYDHTKDKHHTNLYVITSEQDFGKELDKILTMESLRG